MKSLQFTIRAIVSCLILLLLVLYAEPGRLKAAFFDADWVFWFLSLGLALSAFAVSCLKWRMLLLSDGQGSPCSTLAGFYLMGYFFNNFLPTSVGGDAARMFLVGKDSGNYLVGVNSVLADRFSGLLALVLVGFCGILLAPLVIGPTFTALFAGCGIFLWLLLLVPLVYPPARTALADLKDRGRILSFWVGIIGGTLHYFTRPGLFLPLAWTSLVYQLLTVSTYFAAAKALHMDVGLAQMSAIVPVVTLMTLIPVSLNGLGLREGGFAFFLARAGIPEADAIALSLLVYAISLVFSMAGAVVLTFYRKRNDLSGLWSSGAGNP